MRNKLESTVLYRKPLFAFKCYILHLTFLIKTISRRKGKAFESLAPNHRFFMRISINGSTPTQGKSFGLLWRWLNLQLPGPLKKCVGRAEGADRVKVPLSSCSEEPDDSLSEPHEKKNVHIFFCSLPWGGPLDVRPEGHEIRKPFMHYGPAES